MRKLRLCSLTKESLREAKHVGSKNNETSLSTNSLSINETQHFKYLVKMKDKLQR